MVHRGNSIFHASVWKGQWGPAVAGAWSDLFVLATGETSPGPEEE